MNSTAEWVASIPDQVSARRAVILIDEALADADAATKEIVARYNTGTLPPPPWPQHPQLVTAIKALEGGKILLQHAINSGHGDDVEPKDGPLAKRLINGGRELYAQIAVMQQNMKGVKVESVADLAAQLAKKAAATRWGGLAIIAGLLYMDHRFGGDS